MPLDPSIILNAGRGQQQPRSMMQQYGNALALQNAQGEMQMRQNALAQQTAQREAIASAYDPATGNMDPSKLRGALAQSGDLDTLMDFEKAQSTIGKNKAATRKSELERQKEALGLMGQYLGGAQSPEQYAGNLQALRATLGPEWSPPPEIVPPPEQWTPEASQRIGQLALTESQRLEQEWKAKNFGLSERRTRAIESGKTGTSVTVEAGKPAPQVGTIPQGYQLEEVNGAWRMTPVAGGPAALEAAADAERRESQAENKTTAAGVVSEDIGRAKKLIQDNPMLTAGFFGDILSKWAGTDAADVSSLIDTIQANVAFERLQQMREASKTGGALGAISERELSLLSSVLGSLKQSQSAGQLVQNLDRLNSVVNEIVNGPQGAAPGNPAGGQEIPRVKTLQEAMALPPGTKFYTPSGQLKVRP